MAKIDRLGWVAGVAFNAYGVNIGVRVNTVEALEHILPLLPPQWKPASSPVVTQLYSLVVGGESLHANVRRFNLVYTDILRVSRTADLGEALETFESYMQTYLAMTARRWLFIHAAVVGWKGKAILITGGDVTGKTRLVAELVRAGATYYSDEFAVLDSRGRVHPYAKPISIRDEKTQRKTLHPAESFGGTVGSKPLPIGLVLLTQYKSGVRWRPKKLSIGQGIIELLPAAFSTPEQPEKVISKLETALADAVILKGRRGEAQDITSRILEDYF